MASPCKFQAVEEEQDQPLPCWADEDLTWNRLPLQEDAKTKNRGRQWEDVETMNPSPLQQDVGPGSGGSRSSGASFSLALAHSAALLVPPR
jgi:hypothetical protein